MTNIRNLLWAPAQTFRICSGGVCLEPLGEQHFEDLLPIVQNDPIWEFSPAAITTADELRACIHEAQEDRRQGRRLAFAILNQEGRAVGSSSIGNISERDQRLEIGWSWLGQASQGTGVNKRAKFILISLAFDILGMKRVEFKTDVRNARARGGLESIGAIEEGILRSHTLMHTGHRRNTIYYSILAHEWPEVRQRTFNEFGDISYGFRGSGLSVIHFVPKSHRLQ